jgi:hypothetical protein
MKNVKQLHLKLKSEEKEFNVLLNDIYLFRMVRELIAIQNYEQIERICKILSEHFVLSQNGNFRRGGLIGIAALAIACGKVSFENNFN